MSAQVEVLGVKVSAIDPDTAVRTISSWIDSGRREYVCVTGVHGVIESQSDPALIQIHNSAGMVTPDGMPLVWSGRFAGADWMRRVYGPDLMLSVCERSSEAGWSHFLYGAGPGVADAVASRLVDRFPGLAISGTFSPPFRDLTEAEISEVVAMINAARPTIVWIGLSTPKQERWMARFRDLLEAPVLIGVGAAFDIHAGRIAQAPKWMQNSGLEWLFRLSREPRRLWRRYVRVVPVFVWRVLRNRPRLVERPALEVQP